MSKRTFIIGAGRFGKHLATRLSELGCEVVVGDSDATLVKNLAEDGFHTIEMDASDEDSVRESGALDADEVVVALGDNMQGSILACLLLKQLGARRVIARALDVKHAQVLERLGVDEVVLPNREVAHRLAERIHDGGYGERYPLASDYVLAEIHLGPALDGKTLAEAQLPKDYGVTAVLLKRRLGDHVAGVEARADTKLDAGNYLIVVGKRDKVGKFERACGLNPNAR